MTDDFPALATRRLRLRELVAGDAQALFRIQGDPQVMRWFGCDPLHDLAAARQQIDNFHALRRLPSPGVRWAIEPRAGPLAGRLAGTCGLFKWNRGWQVCMVGYELAPEAQGRGYMREALREVFAWAFTRLGIARVEAQVHPDNAASLATLAALGFVREGLQREAASWGGRRHDMVMLGLLPAGFRPAEAGQNP